MSGVRIPAAGRRPAAAGGGARGSQVIRKPARDPASVRANQDTAALCRWGADAPPRAAVVSVCLSVVSVCLSVCQSCSLADQLAGLERGPSGSLRPWR